MAKKLTVVQREALLKLANGEFAQLHIDNYSRTGVRYDVIERLAKLEYVKYINASAVILTPAGAAAIGRADLFLENATAQHEPEASLLLASRTDYGWSVKKLDSAKPEAFDIGDRVIIRKDVEITTGWVDLNRYQKTGVIGVVRALRSPVDEKGFNQNPIEVGFEGSHFPWYLEPRELELWKPEAERISITEAVALQDEIHARLKQEMADGLQQNAPDPDPRDSEIAALKADRQRVLERNLALTEALEDIHGLVNPPETIADSAYPILLRVLDIIENALEDTPEEETRGGVSSGAADAV